MSGSFWISMLGHKKSASDSQVNDGKNRDLRCVIRDCLFTIRSDLHRAGNGCFPVMQPFAKAKFRTQQLRLGTKEPPARPNGAFRKYMHVALIVTNASLCCCCCWIFPRRPEAEGRYRQRAFKLSLFYNVQSTMSCCMHAVVTGGRENQNTIVIDKHNGN